MYIDVHAQRLRRALQHDDLVLDHALHLPDAAVVADQLVAFLRRVVRDAVRHRAVLVDSAEEILHRSHLIREPLRRRRDRVVLALDEVVRRVVHAERGAAAVARRHERVRAHGGEARGGDRAGVVAEGVRRQQQALADRRAAAADVDHDEAAVEERDPLVHLGVDGSEVDEPPRQLSVDELRAEGLARAGELGDVVLFQLALLSLGERRSDRAAERRRIDHLDAVRRLGRGRRWQLGEQGSDGEKKDRGQTNRHLLSRSRYLIAISRAKTRAWPGSISPVKTASRVRSSALAMCGPPGTSRSLPRSESSNLRYAWKRATCWVSSGSVAATMLSISGDACLKMRKRWRSVLASASASPKRG